MLNPDSTTAQLNFLCKNPVDPFLQAPIPKISKNPLPKSEKILKPAAPGDTIKIFGQLKNSLILESKVAQK